MALLGLNAKLYRNTGTYGTPTWTLMNNVTDLTCNDGMDEADVTTRGSAGFSEFEPTIRNLELAFQMVNKLSDTDLGAVKTAYTGRTSIDLLVLDGLIATVGSQGVRARFKVHQFNRGQELRNAQMMDVTMKPCADANPPTDHLISG